MSFKKKQDAEGAITTMNGQWLGSRTIRTNWATRKPPTVRNELPIGPNTQVGRQPNYEEVYTQSSPTNCTVYCGGIMNGLSEDLIQKTFNRFGAIHEIRVFKDKGYAFIKFTSKEAATNAIVYMHNQEVLGQTVKCSWGKETIDSGLAAQAQLSQGLASPSLLYSYGQPLSYWYPQSFNTGLQPSQPYAVQPNMQYPYNQYFAASNTQSNPAFNSALSGMPMPSGWQGTNNNSIANVQNAHHMPMPLHQSTLNTALQQNSVLGSYPMQGYQAQ